MSQKHDKIATGKYFKCANEMFKREKGQEKKGQKFPFLGLVTTVCHLCLTFVKFMPSFVSEEEEELGSKVFCRILLQHTM